MPRNFSPLISGATIAQEDVVRQLLLYSVQVFLYRPAECDSPALAAEFDGLCQQYAPVPFGTDLANFQGLIKDMTRHRAEYYGGGLSSLSAKTVNLDQESVWRLISRLNPKTANAEQTDETLLQARLLLKLAEVQDQEEKEIAETLAQIEGKGLAMLHGLTNEDDEEELAELGSLVRSTNIQRADNLGARLRAWAHLFLHDSRRSEHWLLAASAEVFALLAEYATKNFDDGPRRLISLPLPGPETLRLAPADYRAARDNWQAASSTPLQNLHTGLSALAAGEAANLAPIETSLCHTQQGQPLWTGADLGTLDIYLLPISLENLMTKIANKQHPAPQNENRHSLPYGVVAVHNPAAS